MMSKSQMMIKVENHFFKKAKLISKVFHSQVFISGVFVFSGFMATSVLVDWSKCSDEFLFYLN